jgi:hypothetical protein
VRPSLTSDEFQVGDVRCGDGACQLEPAQVTDAIKEWFARAEENRHEVNLHLIHQTGAQVLLGDIGPTPERHVLASSRLPGQLEGWRDPISDEGERGPALQCQRRPRVMGQDEDGVMKGRVGAPPAVPRSRSIPRPVMPAEHVPPHDRGPDARERLLDYPGALVDLPAFHALELPEHGE